MAGPRDFIKSNRTKVVTVEGNKLTLKRMTMGEVFKMQKDLAALKTNDSTSPEAMAIMLCAAVVDDTENKEWGNVKGVEVAISEWTPETVVAITNEIHNMNGLVSDDEGDAPKTGTQKKVNKS